MDPSPSLAAQNSSLCQRRLKGYLAARCHFSTLYKSLTVVGINSMEAIYSLQEQSLVESLNL